MNNIRILAVPHRPDGAAHHSHRGVKKGPVGRTTQSLLASKIRERLYMRNRQSETHPAIETQLNKSAPVDRHWCTSIYKNMLLGLSAASRGQNKIKNQSFMRRNKNGQCIDPKVTRFTMTQLEWNRVHNDTGQAKSQSQREAIVHKARHNNTLHTLKRLHIYPKTAHSVINIETTIQ